jgi:hypothetical protein
LRGSFGAKHVIPLYRDAEATQPNITRMKEGAGKKSSPLDDIRHY